MLKHNQNVKPLVIDMVRDTLFPELKNEELQYPEDCEPNGKVLIFLKKKRVSWQDLINSILTN